MPVRSIRLGMEGIEYRRGEAHILKGISWSVAAGEHWSVLAPNGSIEICNLSASSNRRGFATFHSGLAL